LTVGFAEGFDEANQKPVYGEKTVRLEDSANPTMNEAAALERMVRRS
jgi:hypothetical protein